MKIGDKVNITDGSYGFGIWDGELISYLPNRNDDRDNLTVVRTGLCAMREANGTRHGEFTQVNDVLVTDGNGNFWFTQTRFCELVNKEIEVYYFCDGIDVTHKLSDETKRNLTCGK